MHTRGKRKDNQHYHSFLVRDIRSHHPIRLVDEEGNPREEYLKNSTIHYLLTRLDGNRESVESILELVIENTESIVSEGEHLSTQLDQLGATVRRIARYARRNKADTDEIADVFFEKPKKQKSFVAYGIDGQGHDPREDEDAQGYSFSDHAYKLA